LHVCKTIQIFIRSVSWNLNAAEMILKKMNRNKRLMNQNKWRHAINS
jgi:hypothetical protein